MTRDYQFTHSGQEFKIKFDPDKESIMVVRADGISIILHSRIPTYGQWYPTNTLDEIELVLKSWMIDHKVNPRKVYPKVKYHVAQYERWLLENES